jgi:CoA:oxalate CoA-transferase
MSMETRMPQGQLSGVRVVDLTRILSGPFCTQLLADLGAEVIKIESPPAGDPIRAQGGVKDGLSWYFASFNRNKRSVSLNLRTPEGKAILRRLIATADVLVENFRPTVLDQMGFGFEELKAIKPDIVVCSISGYGKTGPYRDRPSFDFIAQAMSGFMSTTGYADGEPLRAGLPVSDLVAGLYAALAVSSALWRRDRTGQPEQIDVSLTDALLSFASYFGSTYLATGVSLPRNGNDHPVVAPYGLFAATDGDVAIAPSNDQIYERLVDALGIEEVRHDPDFSTNELRVRNRARINAIVGAKIRQRSRDSWIETLNRAGVPCGRVLTFAEAFCDPQVLAREMVVEVDHPGHGPVRMIGFPMKFREAACAMRSPAPALGSDTEAVLTALDYDDAEIQALREQGII